MRNFLLVLMNCFVFFSNVFSQVTVLDTSETSPCFTISNSGLNKVKVSSATLSQSNITAGKFGFIVVSKPYVYNANTDLIISSSSAASNPSLTNRILAINESDVGTSAYNTGFDFQYGSISSNPTIIGNSSLLSNVSNKLIATSKVFVYLCKRNSSGSALIVKVSNVCILELPPETLSKSSSVSYIGKICPTTFAGFFGYYDSSNPEEAKDYTWKNENDVSVVTHTNLEVLNNNPPSYSSVSPFPQLIPASANYLIKMYYTNNGQTISSVESFALDVLDYYLQPNQQSYPSNFSIFSLTSNSIVASASFGSGLSDINDFRWIVSNTLLDQSYIDEGFDENFDLIVIPSQGLLSNPITELNLNLSSADLAVGQEKTYFLNYSDKCNTFYNSNLFTVFRLPTPNVTNYNNQTLCSGSQVSSIDKPLSVPLNGRTYTWAIFNTTSPSAIPLTGSETVQSGDYYVRYKLNENNTDYYSDTYATINVTAVSSEAGSISAPNPSTICSGAQPGEITSLTSGTSSAGIVSYEWQSGGSTIAGATESTYEPGVLTSTTSYKRRTVATYGSTVCYSAYTLPAVTITVNAAPSGGTVSGNQSICSGSTPSQIQLFGHSGSIQWQSSTNNSTFTDISGQTGENLTPGALSTTTYYRAILTQGTCTSTSTVATVTVNASGTWLGGSTTITPAAYNTAANWCGGSVPTSPTIPPGVTVYMDGSYDFTNVTVECGGSLIITETGRVYITNVLTNGGLVHVINGGTIKYNTTVSGSCTGTYKITETFTPSRFWYVGPTTTNATRGSFGSAASTSFWSWNESTQGYTSISNESTALTPGVGYVYRNNQATNLVVDMTGPYVTSNVALTGLGRVGTGATSGMHLVSNPYTAYIDANKIFGMQGAAANNLTTGMQNGIWVRSQNTALISPSTNPQGMCFDTYNANSGHAVVLSGNPTGNASANARYIAPMQAFWVRTAQGQTGTLGFTYAMTEVSPSGAGQLRTSSIEGLARLNVYFGSQKDQMLAVLSPNAQNGFENYDSEKMFISGIVQLYAQNSGKKLVINSVKNNKSKVSMPITVECPSSGWYNFELAELELPNGILFLEDKVTGEMHNFTSNENYNFFSNSGVVSNRFVLHFHLPTAVANPSGPSSIDDLVSETQNAVIDIRANGSGKVNVSLDMVDEETNSFVRICDMNGRMLESFQIDGSSFEFQMNHGQGIYLVEVSNGLTVEKKKVFVQ